MGDILILEQRSLLNTLSTNRYYCHLSKYCECTFTLPWMPLLVLTISCLHGFLPRIGSSLLLYRWISLRRTSQSPRFASFSCLRMFDLTDTLSNAFVGPDFRLFQVCQGPVCSIHLVWWRTTFCILAFRWWQSFTIRIWVKTLYFSIQKFSSFVKPEGITSVLVSLESSEVWFVIFVMKLLVIQGLWQLVDLDAVNSDESLY
jgi:hypothetical protein